MKKKKIIAILLAILAFILIAIGIFFLFVKDNSKEKTVNLTDLTMDGVELTKYKQDDFEKFVSDYQNSSLPEVYVTEFLFDGVGMYKTYDLDDFIESGNEVEVKALDITTVNINTDDITLTGKLTGMIAVDTNNKTNDININLKDVNINTDSKKVPAIYIYNKDITYTKTKVTINPLKDTKNYIEGGKLKKVSLMDSTNLTNYSSKYNGENLTNYTMYTNYYGVYTKDELDNILFAKVEADNEDLADGDPVYYYKASGAISSDIDLYFEGEGYLEITSNKKEGVETKGNLTFAGGVGDYVINAQDDCLNTTTDSQENTNARNTLTIDVNSLTAIVANDADEGDAIDSNGQLVINAGNILAIAKPGSDAGLDSEKGTYINGGTVIATGDMLDQISNESKQNFMTLQFQNKQQENNVITILDENENVIMSYKTDRTYSYLVYSSKDLVEGTYSVYKDGTVEGEESNGVYTNISKYTKGTQQGYVSNEVMNGMGGGQMPQMDNQDGERPEIPDGERPEMPDGERPEKPDENQTMPSRGEMPQDSNGMGQGPNDNMVQGSATNKDFTISGIQNQFSGVADLQEG